MNFGKNLAMIRKHKNISQEELAFIVRFSLRCYSIINSFLFPPLSLIGSSPVKTKGSTPVS